MRAKKESPLGFLFLLFSLDVHDLVAGVGDGFTQGIVADVAGDDGGAGRQIPPNATLTFDVELLDAE